MDNHCQECGMLVEPATAFHPYIFCLLKKANPRCDPWEEFRWAVESVTDVALPKRPPLIRNLPIQVRQRDA